MRSFHSWHCCCCCCCCCFWADFAIKFNANSNCTTLHTENGQKCLPEWWPPLPELRLAATAVATTKLNTAESGQRLLFHIAACCLVSCRRLAVHFFSLLFLFCLASSNSRLLLYACSFPFSSQTQCERTVPLGATEAANAAASVPLAKRNKRPQLKLVRSLCGPTS